MPSKPRVEIVPIETLTEDPGNARRHGRRNRDASKASVEAFGAARSLVCDGDGKVLAGNGTLRSLRETGVKRAIVVDTDGSDVVVVRRKDLTGARGAAYSVADNAVSDLDNDFDPSRLEAIRREAEGTAHSLDRFGLDAPPPPEGHDEACRATSCRAC
jgi:hypothetical protein